MGFNSWVCVDVDLVQQSRIVKTFSYLMMSVPATTSLLVGHNTLSFEKVGLGLKCLSTHIYHACNSCIAHYIHKGQNTQGIPYLNQGLFVRTQPLLYLTCCVCHAFSGRFSWCLIFLGYCFH